MDINSKLFKDRNAYLETKSKEVEKKTIKLKPKKFNRLILDHIESYKNEIISQEEKSILKKKNKNIQQDPKEIN